MHGIAYYFSGTGNTKYLLERLSQDLQGHGSHLTLAAVETLPRFSEDYDFYVFAAPIHGEFFPAMYLNWVRSQVVGGSGKPCLVLTTLAAASVPTGLGHMAGILKRRGFRIAAQQSFTMPNNWPSRLFDIPDEARIQELRQEAAAAIAQLADRFAAGQEHMVQPNRLMYLSMLPFRGIVAKYIERWADRSLTVDPHVCVNCGLCVRICPVSNLGIKDGKVIQSGHCIACMRCVHACPVNAFLVRGQEVRQILRHPLPVLSAAMDDSD